LSRHVHIGRSTQEAESHSPHRRSTELPPTRIRTHTRSTRTTQGGELRHQFSSRHQCRAGRKTSRSKLPSFSASAAHPTPCSSSHAPTERVVVRQASVVTARAARKRTVDGPQIHVAYHTKQQVTQHLRVLHAVRPRQGVWRRHKSHVTWTSCSLSSSRRHRPQRLARAGRVEVNNEAVWARCACTIP
jgi:hypothetical protein